MGIIGIPHPGQSGGQTSSTGLDSLLPSHSWRLMTASRSRKMWETVMIPSSLLDTISTATVPPQLLLHSMTSWPSPFLEDATQVSRQDSRTSDTSGPPVPLPDGTFRRGGKFGHCPASCALDPVIGTAHDPGRFPAERAPHGLGIVASLGLVPYAHP